MSLLQALPLDAPPITPDIREQIVEPIVEATRMALGEMAGEELFVQRECCIALANAMGDIAATLAIKPGNRGTLVLSFPRATATALATRILSSVAPEIDEKLVRDCMGEIANVVGGQAKALLAESVHPLVFAMPPRVMDAVDARFTPGAEVLVVVLASECGEFAVQLQNRGK